jgi:hypothetical protein
MRKNVHLLNPSRLTSIGRISVNVLLLDYEIRYLVGALMKTSHRKVNLSRLFRIERSASFSENPLTRFVWTEFLPLVRGLDPLPSAGTARPSCWRASRGRRRNFGPVFFQYVRHCGAALIGHNKRSLQSSEQHDDMEEV